MEERMCKVKRGIKDIKKGNNKKTRVIRFEKEENKELAEQIIMGGVVRLEKKDN